MRKKDVLFGKAVQEAVRDSTFYVEGEVKQSIAGHRAEHVSVDTGRFLNSVASSIEPGVGTVGTSVEYGPFLEYGTSTLRERRHFRNTKQRSEPKVKGFFSSRIKKASD